MKKIFTLLILSLMLVACDEEISLNEDLLLEEESEEVLEESVTETVKTNTFNDNLFEILTKIGDTYERIDKMNIHTVFQSKNEVEYYHFKINEIKKEILYAELNPTNKNEKILHDQYLTTVYYYVEYLDYLKMYLNKQQSVDYNLSRKYKENFKFEYSFLTKLINN